MGKLDFTRDRLKRQQHTAARSTTRAEIAHQAQQTTTQIIKGMGKGRHSKAADQFMGAEPVKRISPTSAEGRAIIARLGLPP